MIGFSSIPYTENQGFACLYSESTGVRLIAFRDLRPYLDDLVKREETITTLDSKALYRNLFFLGTDLLSRLRIFDLQSYYHNVHCQTNLNLVDRGKEFYGIDLATEKKRIEKMWFIQREKNWRYVPPAIAQVYLEKEAILAYQMRETLTKVNIATKNADYLRFFRDFLLYLVKLEKIGIASKDGLVHPTYEYDRVSTGRLINIEPFCFQTASIEKVLQPFKSRFDNGNIWLADWRNADFRVAAALSKETLIGPKNDPYSYFASKILGKDDITEEERDEAKRKVLSVMYGFGIDEGNMFFKTYPEIAQKKREVTQQAKKDKSVTTIFGKTRVFAKNDNFDTKAFASLCQMTVADLCKRAVIELQKEFTNRGLESVPIPIIRYDSFCFDIKAEEEETAKEAIQTAMIERTIPEELRFYVNFEVSISKMTNIYEHGLENI